MKKTIWIILSVVAVFFLKVALGQGNLYLSNIGEPSGGSSAVASDAWIAQGFQTGTNPGGYALNSIQLLMVPPSGSPNGFTVLTYVQTIPRTLIGPDPTVGGVFTYTASDILLSPSTGYYVGVRATTPVAQGAFRWSEATTFTHNSGDGWSFFSFYLSSTDGTSWQVHPDPPFQLAIQATAVPEPAICALAGLFLSALLVRKKLK